MILVLAAAQAAADPLGIAKAITQDCPSSDTSEIVVCGSREKGRRYRLPSLPTEYEAPRRSASTEIAAGVQGRIHVDPVQLPGGVKSNRVLVTVGTKF